MSWFNLLVEKYPIRFFIFTGVLLYSYSLFNFFVGDDFDQLVNNTFIHSLSHLPYFFLGGTFNNGFVDLSGIYYKPLMTICFSILYTFFHASPFFYHLTQLSFHIANTILCFFLFKKFFPKQISFIAAVIFLVHPINTEAVVYISNLQDVLFTFFGLLGLYILFYKRNAEKYFILSSVLFLCSLLSKETGVIFVLIAIFYQLLYSRGNLLKQIIYSVGVLGIYAALRIHAVGVYKYHNEIFPMMHLSLQQRLLNIPQIIFYYLKTVIYPVHLAFAQNWVVKGMSFEKFFFPLFLILILFAALILVGLKVRKEKKYEKAFYFFVVWFLLGLSLHLQVFPLDMTVADRWFYLPFIGLLGMLCVLYLHFEKKVPKNETIAYIGVGLMSLLFVLTFFRSLNWQNQYTLYGHDVQYNTDSFSLLNGWGSELINVGKFKEAEPYIRRSIAIEPNYCHSWNNLGTIYIQKKDFDQARKFFQTGIDRRGCALAYNNLATLLYYHYSTDEAYTFIKQSLKELPTSPRLWLMLALIEHKKGNKNEALEAAKKSYKYGGSTSALYVYQNILQNKEFELKEY